MLRNCILMLYIVEKNLYEIDEIDAEVLDRLLGEYSFKSLIM